MSSARRPHGGSAGGAGKPNDKAREEARRAAMQKALQTKQLQEQALTTLPRRKLYLVLHLRKDPPEANDFHWGLYYHKGQAGGTKYHVKNMSGGWIPDHAATGGLFKSNFLCVVIRIGTIPEDKEQQLDQLVRKYDGNLNATSGMTCRVWVMKVLELLEKDKLVECPSLTALETECFNFGNQHMVAAARSEHPRPVVVSTKCH